MLDPKLLTPAALPAGYALHGVACGISSRRGKKDLALFLSLLPAAAAAVFTKNLVKAAPVLVSRARVRAARSVRAILVNSGNANACTGSEGLAVSKWSTDLLAKGLGAPVEEVLVASTGVIGRPLPRGPLARGVKELLSRVASPSKPKDAVAAILTTDNGPKAARATFTAGGRRYTLWGCCKGAGMIHPNMATMLAFLLTDIGLPKGFLQAALSEAVEETFNRASVDGDTSTNDSVFLLANGALGALNKVPAGVARAFKKALKDVCASLAEQIVADGEGATRVATIVVQGARDEKSAKLLASTVATSALVKTALHGADPNWGRVLGALGRAGVNFDPSRVDVRFGNITVCRRGVKAAYSEKAAHKILKKDRVQITIDVHGGKARAHYVTCDYSRDYIRINADYTT